MALRNNKSNNALRWVGTVAVAAGLFVGATALAGAATSHTSAPRTAPAAPAPHGQPPFGVPGGKVTAVSASSLTVQRFDGTSTTYTLNSSTVVTKDGAAATLSDLVVGAHVHVLASTADATVAASVAIETHAAPGAPGAPGRTLNPELAGKVVAVTDGTITVADPEGFWRTIVTNSSTTYQNNGAAGTRSDVTVGSFVQAAGTVDANHTSLDAASVLVSATPLNGGFGPGGNHGPEGHDGH